MKTAIPLFAALLMLISTVAQAAGEKAGTVGYMSGALVAQRLDGTIKVLAPKSEVFAGDMLITAKDSYAQVKMNDGTQMTLRPNSNLRIEAFQFNRETPQTDNAVLRLLKGGFRTVTGLIGKRGNADAYKLRAAAATIGIRGTDFTSRLCASKDCKDDDEEAAKPAAAPQALPQQVIGRVMLVQGELSAKEAGGKVRQLILGGLVYEGDALTTGAKSHAVVAFRDEGRVTLQENTVFQVEKFKYDKVASQENAVMKLLKGGVRVVTGLIGRARHDNYLFKVASATIGIRGTGFDAWCNGPCASGADNPGATPGNPLDGAGVYVWQGEVMLVSPGGSFIVAIQQAAIIARDTGKPMRIIAIPPSITDNKTPRPDSVPVDVEKLFGNDANAGDAGLYVTVHDGQVVLMQDGKALDLGRGETGFARDEILARLATTPAFMDGDPKMDPTGDTLKDSDKHPGIPEGGCKL
ncbi:MAG: FecR domain-containing protein [Nitrosomonadales bacterium]|nr:FecR domain-containing protein [Nitrosomonadales bacterium]